MTISPPGQRWGAGFKKTDNRSLAMTWIDLIVFACLCFGAGFALALCWFKDEGKKINDEEQE